jgi:UDP-4-amino-4,6-dideoxy-N-acetyl-beta-L-altrosamine transaminase
MIPYGRQEITAEDIEAVIEALKSDFITQGPKVPQFEKAVAHKVGAKHGVAVNSATSALHLACRALELAPGDIVWTSPITFVASANCARYCGADIDFVDIDPRTYNMSINALEEKLISAERNGKLPKIVIPVHLCGQSCEMAPIAELAKRYNFAIIEDASHAIGGRYKSEPVGSCRYSDIAVFSFHPVKIITTAEGGMAMTNDDGLARQMALLRSHGITREQERMTHQSEGPWYYQQIDLGYNYRMTDIQAALGLKQLNRLDEYVDNRNFLAGRYDEALTNLPVIVPWQHPETYSAFHLYPIRIAYEQAAITRDDLFDMLHAKGIGVNVHYIPVHLQPYYRGLGFAPGDYIEAEKYYTESLTLPLFPTMGMKVQDEILSALKKIFAPNKYRFE